MANTAQPRLVIEGIRTPLNPENILSLREKVDRDPENASRIISRFVSKITSPGKDFSDRVMEGTDSLMGALTEPAVLDCAKKAAEGHASIGSVVIENCVACTIYPDAISANRALTPERRGF